LKVAVECTAPAPQPAELERDLYALLRGICEDVIDWMATLSYDNIGGKEVLDHPLTKEIRLKLQRMYDHPLDNKLLIRTDQLERILDDAATPQVTPCLGYPKCDGDLPGEKHEAECPAFEGTSEQASPTPDKCPRCGSKDYWTALPACHGGIADSWHSSAATQTEK
jgi:hypothetical protein